MSDLSAYPNVPGAQDRDTSRDAADAIAPTAPILRAMALAALERSGGLTADQVADKLGRSPLSIRPRITELTRLGKVRATSERRPNASGKKAIVWQAIKGTGTTDVDIGASDRQVSAHRGAE